MSVYQRMMNGSKRRLVIVCVVLSCTGLLLALGLGWLKSKGAAERYKEELVAKGEVLDLKKLIPPQSQVVVKYYESFAALAAGVKDTPVSYGLIDLRSPSKDGFAMPAWSMATPVGTTTWSALAEQLGESAPNLAELRTLIRNRPHGSLVDPAYPYAQSGSSDAIIAKRRTATALGAAALVALHEGRLLDAQANLDSLLDLARLNEPDNFLLGHMIRSAIAELALSLSWQALQSPGWTDSKLMALQGRVQSLSLLADHPRVIEMERAAIVAALAFGRTSEDARRQMLSGGSGRLGLMERVHGGAYSMVWMEADQLRYLQRMQRLLESVRTSVAARDYPGFRSAFSKPPESRSSLKLALDRLRYPISEVASPYWDKAASRILVVETERSQALAAIAVHRFLLRHGKLPPGIDQLTPDFIERWPDDSLGNGPLVYRRIDDRRFVLLSPGEDGRDDGANGDDIVWPAVRELPAASRAGP